MKYYGGIDLGGTNSKIGLLDENANIIFSKIVKTQSEKGYVETVKRLSNIFLELLKEYNINFEDFISLGIGIPGPVKDNTTVLCWANFPWPDNLNLANEFKKYINKEIYLENDVNIIMLGENWVGASKGYKNVFGIAIGTGVGGALIMDGKICSGKNGAAGEVGHMPLFREGRKCGCGLNGCFEAYTSASSLCKIAIENLEKNSILYNIYNEKKELEAKDIFDAAKEKDQYALKIAEEYYENLAYGISTISVLIDPEVIVIGGGVSLLGDYLINNIRKYLNNIIFKSLKHKTIIKVAKLGNHAGIYGSAYLAMLLSEKF